MDDCLYDAIVIGGGPSGLFAALELARAGKRIALVEKGGYMAQSLCPKIEAHVSLANLKYADRYRAQCKKCTCLYGIGGAAFHFDSNLGYIKRLSRSKIEPCQDGSVRTYSSLERAIGSFAQAEDSIKEVYDIFFDFGLTRLAPDPLADAGFLHNEQVFAHSDTEESLPVDLDRALKIIGKMEQTLAALGTRMFVWTCAETIERGTSRRWRLQVRPTTGGDAFQLEADAIVMGVGKSALPWVLSVLDQVGIAYEKNQKVDIGVRLETLRGDVAPITRACHNPKLTFLSRRGEPVRTFCVCDGGRVMQYQMAGVTILDGQHCVNSPTSNTNFGMLTTVTLPQGVSGTEYALQFATMVNIVGQGRPIVQRFADFVDGQPTESLGGNAAQTTLSSYTLGDLNRCFPSFLVNDVIDMAAHLNAVAPGSVQPYCLITAPVIERIYPAIQLDSTMETSQPGLFIVGDSSSKIMGITAGAATGLRAARAILSRSASMQSV